MSSLIFVEISYDKIPTNNSTWCNLNSAGYGSIIYYKILLWLEISFLITVIIVTAADSAIS